MATSYADMSFELSPESIKILPKMPQNQEQTTAFQVRLAPQQIKELETRARALNEYAAAEAINLHTPVTGEHLVKTLIYWYLATNGHAQVTSVEITAK